MASGAMCSGNPPPPSSYPSPSSLPSRRARNHAQEVWARQRTGTHTKPALNRRTRDTQTQTTQIAQQIGAFRDEGGEATGVPEALADGGSPVPLIPPPAPKDAHFLRFRPPTKIPPQARTRRPSNDSGRVRP